MKRYLALQHYLGVPAAHTVSYASVQVSQRTFCSPGFVNISGWCGESTYKNIVQFSTLNLSLFLSSEQRESCEISSFISGACPVGSYHDMSKDECLDCPRNYYQDLDAQTVCKRCPEGRYSEAGAYTYSLCKYTYSGIQLSSGDKNRIFKKNCSINTVYYMCTVVKYKI